MKSPGPRWQRGPGKTKRDDAIGSARLNYSSSVAAAISVARTIEVRQ
jgi:hypothetical protein